MKDCQTGNLTGLPSLTYTYHPQLTLDTLGSYVTGTTYDAAGRITSRLLGSSGLRQDFAYTDWNTQYQGGRLDTIKAGSAPNYNNLQNLDYGYDKGGNILSILDVTNSSQVQCFTYDALNRLTRGTTTNDTANGCGTTQLGVGNYDQSYTYNTANGNLSSKAGLSYTYNDTNHDHAVTHLGGVQKYWYDTNGNQVTRYVGIFEYELTYDAENRLVEVKMGGMTIAAFVYDGDGNRVKSTISGVTTAFIGNHTEWEVNTSSLTRYYYAGSTRVAMRKNNTVYYLLSDHLGFTSVTTDQNGQNLAKQYYLPWGEVRYSSGSLQTKYTYTGQYSNVSDFGLMYYNARWYDPALSRFSSADTIVPQPGNPQDWDRYGYVYNNPIRNLDPSGHRACSNRDENGNCASEIYGDLYVSGYDRYDFEKVHGYQGDTPNCGPYSLASVLSLMTGISYSGDQVNDLLVDKKLKISNLGIPGLPLVVGSKQIAPDIELIYSIDGTIGQLKKNINKGYLTIVGVSWQTTTEITRVLKQNILTMKEAVIEGDSIDVNDLFNGIFVGHWLVVAGYNDEKEYLILLDSGYEYKKFTIWSYSEFENYWKDQQNVFIGSGETITFPSGE